MPEIKEASPEYERLLAEFVAVRNNAGLSQKRLAEQVGVTQNIVGRIENKTHVPSVETLLKILAPMGKTLAIVDLDN